MAPLAAVYDPLLVVLSIAVANTCVVHGARPGGPVRHRGRPGGRHFPGRQRADHGRRDMVDALHRHAGIQHRHARPLRFVVDAAFAGAADRRDGHRLPCRAVPRNIGTYAAGGRHPDGRRHRPDALHRHGRDGDGRADRLPAHARRGLGGDRRCGGDRGAVAGIPGSRDLAEARGRNGDGHGGQRHALHGDGGGAFSCPARGSGAIRRRARPGAAGHRHRRRIDDDPDDHAALVDQRPAPRRRRATGRGALSRSRPRRLRRRGAGAHAADGVAAARSVFRDGCRRGVGYRRLDGL